MDEAAASLDRDLKEIGGRHLVVQADVTDATDVARLVDLAREHCGELDVLVNNVGVDGPVPFTELPEQEWHRMLDHNVTATYLVTQAALALLVDGSSIVSVGSSVALRGRANGVHYTASKAALIGFTRGLCKEVGPRGIRVNVVAPGLTETEPGAGLPPAAVERIVGMTALGRICQPEDVAGAVLFLAGDTYRYITQGPPTTWTEASDALRGHYLQDEAGARGRDRRDLRRLPAGRHPGLRRRRRRGPTARHRRVHQGRGAGPDHPLRRRVQRDRRAHGAPEGRAPDRGEAALPGRGAGHHVARGVR